MRNWWKILLAGLAILILLALVAFVFFGGLMIRGGFSRSFLMGPGMMRGYFPGGFGIFRIFGLLSALILPLLLIGLIVAGAFAVGRAMRPASSPAVPAPSQPCPNCGRPLQSGWIACPHCGQKLADASEPVI